MFSTIDLVMPLTMGFEAVGAMRNIPELATVPIIAVSASVLRVDQEHSRRVGCNDFMTKPLEVKKVFETLQKYMDLEWVYNSHIGENKREAPTTDEVLVEVILVPPPQLDLEILYELARFGSMERIKEHAHYLESLSAEYKPFVERLLRLVDAFDDVQIQVLIKQYLVSQPDKAFSRN